MTKAPKPHKCKNCRQPATMRYGLIWTCSAECAILVSLAKIKQKAERVARKVLKDGRIALRTRKDHEALAKDAVQLYARLRDHLDGCISCSKPASWQGIWHGSHFMQAGSRSATRFNLWNINKSCNQCNLFKGGAPAPYEISLIAKIGLEKVEWLKRQTQVVKYSVEYMQRIAKVFNKRARILKKRLKRL